MSASANGLETGALRFPLLTQGNLDVAATTPTDGSEQIATRCTHCHRLHRPVVPLGAKGDDPSLPQPLALDPQQVAKGSG